jgi:beta-galactosidase
MCAGPCFSRTSLAAPSAGKDTILDTTPIQKGFAWVNGVSLGRAWSAGPQASLLIPGSGLKQGQNSLVVLDLQADRRLVLRTVDHA